MLTIFALSRIILIIAAIIPGFVLLRYIYRHDRLEKEPSKLLGKLFLLGIISTICAVFTETIGSNVLGAVFYEGSFIYLLIENFIVIALSEEGFKYMVLSRATWKNPNFNCTFDGVVYSVYVSLGFAVWENIQYVLRYGFGNALVRAVTAVPGHACFGVLMGAFYALAKKHERDGNIEGMKNAKKLAVIVPIIAHGAYDFFASISSFVGSLGFIVVIAIIFLFSFKLVKGLSQSDEYIDQ